jgi:hypothetical protein
VRATCGLEVLEIEPLAQGDQSLFIKHLGL